MDERRRRLAVELVELAISASFLYCALRPDTLESVRGRLDWVRQKILDELSVWLARREIRRLPEV